MTGFVFNTPPSIRFGAGARKQLGEITSQVLGSRVLLVTDKGLVQAGLVGPVIDRIAATGASVAVFNGVVADPPEAILMEAVAMAKSHDATGILGFGGGSALDVAKLAALLTCSGEVLEQAYGVGNAKGPRLPLVLVPTTAGTGSEVTPISIITTGTIEKKGVVSPLLLPDVAVLDPELTLGLPPHVTAATGIDAMVHAIEAITSASPNNNPVSRALATEALTLLGRHISTAVHDGGNLEARSGMLLGSMLAGQAFANSPVAAVHALAYPIGGIHHVPHGLSNALVLPHVIRFNRNACRPAYAQIARVLFPDLAEATRSQRADALSERMAALSASLGLEQRLRDVGITEEDLPMLASEAMKQTRLLVNNPRPVTQADALAIYKAAW